MNRDRVTHRIARPSRMLLSSALRRILLPRSAAAMLCAAIALGNAPLSAQTVVLDDGFESYPTGPLGAQGGWTSIQGPGPGIAVVSSPVKTGARALLVPCDTPGYPLPGTPASAFQLPVYSQVGRVEADVMKENAVHDYLTIGLRAGPDYLTSSAGCELYFSNNGEIRWWGTPYPFTQLTIPTPYNGGQWYRVRIDWFANSTVDITIDGVLVAAGFNFAAALPGGVNWVRFTSGASDDGPGSNVENAWFDNVKLTLFDYSPTAVPTSTWGALKIAYR
jgi:hypothetical protein